MKFLDNIKEYFSRDITNPLKAENVRFKYKDISVLKDLSLNIKTNKIVSIIGKSGSGKSTFLKLTTGVLSRNFHGKIQILGRDQWMAKKDFGFVPQYISLIPHMTIEQNMKLFGSINSLPEHIALNRGIELLKILELDISLDALPTELSGGQQVRLNIICSILHNPKVLILDEPFEGLDFYNRRLIWHFLDTQKKKGKSIVLTTHLLSEAEDNSDKILILKNGRVEMYGSPESIKKRLKTQYIFEIQFQYLSKEDLEEIKYYCQRKTIELLDQYNKYIMFSLEEEKQKLQLEKLFDKRKLKYKELSFRQPNMDEAFLRTRI